jgi:hypothetical protein
MLEESQFNADFAQCWAKTMLHLVIVDHYLKDRMTEYIGAPIDSVSQKQTAHKHRSIQEIEEKLRIGKDVHDCKCNSGRLKRS